ncbi:SIMIBI class G3E GTPase ArgK/MeaB, partial [Trinorchestia longiramus]
YAQELRMGLKQQHRAALAQAITLIETTHPIKKKTAARLLDSLLKDAAEDFAHRGPSSLSLRLGLSGPPGAGKSTFIERLGKHLTSAGHRVAVLAVDPSSATTGGSILGDKTRMPELTIDPAAFIRPSPARGHLGGVTRSTNEAIVLCEAAGYDIIIVETVGVGQSEVSVADMVDLFGLVIAPGGGDELQGLKKGIVEMCDMVIVNKSDGDLAAAAMRTQSDYLSSLKYARPRWHGWRVPVLRVSSLTGEGLENLWSTMTQFKSHMFSSGQFLQRRRDQQKTWLHSHLLDAVLEAFKNTSGMSEALAEMERKVVNGLVTPGSACDALI